MDWRRWFVTVGVVSVIAACGGLDFEQKIRVATDCPDSEKVEDVVFVLADASVMQCVRIRVVSGPPYRNASWLECNEPLGRDRRPPHERTGTRFHQ